MKKLAVIALEKHTLDNLKEDLHYIFGDALEISWYYLEDITFGSRIEADLYLYTSPNYYFMTRNLLESDAEVIIMKRTISREGFEMLKNLPYKGKAMLVNRTLEMSIEMISELRELGIHHLELVPVYPGMEDVPILDIAITPDHTGTVPDCVTKVYNIGNRKLDVSTLMDITEKLQLHSDRIEKRIEAYSRQIVPFSDGLRRIIDTKNEMEKALEILVRLNDKAILVIDRDGRILMRNPAAEMMFQLDTQPRIDPVLMEALGLRETLDTGRTRRDFIATCQQRTLIVSSLPIIWGDALHGGIALCEEFNDFERKHQRMRKEIIRQGHVARYSFSDIVFDSDPMKAVEQKCRKIARNDAAVLILGESGTGKEMFAQAIHNDSPRKDGPFVAINCATLSGNLLESELFGYEEGAFTGAVKGGKKGLFESAYGGTVFLDEIGEMPTHLQAKLLRALEEREIRRVGGNKLISVDVRIIAATNKPLREQIRLRTFREDLYYRLCTFTVALPRLQDRREDIRKLVRRFTADCRYFRPIPEPILRILDRYPWPGNVRELRNAVAYMTEMAEGPITTTDLPVDLVAWMEQADRSAACDTLTECLPQLGLSQGPEPDALARCLVEAYERKENLGRRSLSGRLQEQGLFITESETKRILSELQKQGVVQTRTGRSGTRLTEEGYRRLKGETV